VGEYGAWKKGERAKIEEERRRIRERREGGKI
jgi:hypothetical protein